MTLTRFWPFGFVITLTVLAATPEEELAQSFDKWIHEGQVEAVNNAYDVPQFFERLHGKISGDEAAWKEFSSACIKQPFLGNWYCQTAQRAHIKFLRVFAGDKESRALFTFYDFTGLNHLELIIASGEKGPRIVDHRMLSTGEFFSEEKRFAYLTYLQNKFPEVFKKLGEENAEVRDSLKLADLIDEVQAALRDGKNQQVLKIYDSLPEQYKGNKKLLLLRLNAATWLLGADWKKAIEDFEKYCPGDPQSELFKIDVFIREKKVDEAFKAIDAYDKVVGGEPLLNLFRANALDYAGRAAEAIPYAQKAVDAAPRLPATLNGLLHCQLLAKEYDGAVKTIEAIDGISGFDISRFKQDPTAADFLKSPQFLKWEAKQK